jgi:hypothetical protein
MVGWANRRPGEVAGCLQQALRVGALAKLPRTPPDRAVDQEELIGTG